jgi:hypothetical protein
VIEVSVGVDDGFDRQAMVLNDLANLFDLTTGIDDDGLLALVAGEHRAVAGEGTSWKCLSKQHGRIIVQGPQGGLQRAD